MDAVLLNVKPQLAPWLHDLSVQHFLTILLADVYITVRFDFPCLRLFRLNAAIAHQRWWVDDTQTYGIASGQVPTVHARLPKSASSLCLATYSLPTCRMKVNKYPSGFILGIGLHVLKT